MELNFKSRRQQQQQYELQKIQRLENTVDRIELYEVCTAT